MFVLDEDDTPRRWGLPGILVLVLVAAGVVVAVRWDQSVRAPAADRRTARQADIRYWRDHYADHRYGCSTDVAVAFGGDKPGAEEIQQAVRAEQTAACTDQIAGDPRRVLLSPPDMWDNRARKTNAAMDRALCPTDARCGEPDPNNPIEPPPLTNADVTAIRQALADIGHPDAEVRPAQPGDGAPPETVMYGIPLGHKACAVSYAVRGQHPAQLGAVGALTNGKCLAPAAAARPN